MKRLIVALILLFSSPALGADVSIAWDANPETSIKYRLYAVQYADSYDFTTHLYDGEATSCTVTVADNAEYKFVVRAYLVGASGRVYESGNSNQVVHAVVVWENPNLRTQ